MEEFINSKTRGEAKHLADLGAADQPFPVGCRSNHLESVPRQIRPMGRELASYVVGKLDRDVHGWFQG